MDIRADAWYADLSESQQWQLYAISRRTRNWAEVVQAARDNFKLEGEVSRSSFYRWRDKMRQADAEQRRLSIIASQAQAREVAASYDIKDPVIVNALLAFATDRAAQDDTDNAAKLIKAAMAIKDRQQKDAELKLKSARQKTADDQLKLAREKFEAAEKRLAAMAELSDAARGGKVDPAKVADEIDRILGRKK
ncbi:MAG: hypothetical protein II863_18990 [Kiritimatiellae bacterium]|nr:hypothetical protein [Kiritimatiellia bacterium]